MDYIKRFLGLSQENPQFRGNFQHFHREDQNDPVESENNGVSDSNSDLRRPSFHIFSDPLHMQQYFEYQMNEMLKSFGVEGFDNGFFSNFYSNIPPALQDESQFNEGNSSKDLRDQFLKNGYEKPSQKNFEKTDKDIDGRVQLGDLDSIFGNKNNTNPHEHASGGFFFGQSQSIKTIRNPDGCIETHRTVRDNEGNEETTICRKLGDKEYCVSKKKDKYGKEEITENLVNMNEEEKNILLNMGDKLPIEKDKPVNTFPFDKFFK